MAKRTTIHVHLTGPDGEPIVVAPGEDVPDDIAELITNETVWEGYVDAEQGGSEEPPRSGKGSGIEAWRNHAESLGLTVHEDDDRESIIAAVDALKD